MSWSLVVFTDQYEKRAVRFMKRHPELEKQYLKTLQLMEANGIAFTPHSACIHSPGVSQVCTQFPLTSPYRITLEFLIQEQEIIPVNAGDHDAY